MIRVVHLNLEIPQNVRARTQGHRIKVARWVVGVRISFGADVWAEDEAKNFCVVKATKIENVVSPQKQLVGHP